MYIMETGLPIGWSIIWIVISTVVITLSVTKVKNVVRLEKDLIKYNVKVLLIPLILSFIVMIILTLSNVRYGNPLVSGNGVATITTTFIPSSILATIAIIVIKLFTGIGGFYSIGANVFAIAIAGPYLGYTVYKLINDRNPSYNILAVILGVIVTEISSILVTCFQLALAYHYPTIIGSFIYHVNMYLLSHLTDILILIAIEAIITIIIIKIMSRLVNNKQLSE